MYKTLEGSTISAMQEFIDEDTGQPFICKPGYPTVILYDADKMMLSKSVASPDTVPGRWVATVNIPMLGITSETDLTLKWIARDAQGNKDVSRDIVAVLPISEERDTDVVALVGDTSVTVTLPTDNTTVFKYQIYQGNTPLINPIGDLTTPSPVQVITNKGSTSLALPVPSVTPSMQSLLLMLEAGPIGRTDRYSYRMWVVTPQIFNMINHLEAFINKSRLENVIPELRYTMGDLMGYLERGLNLWNTIEKFTSFTGMNMQGPLFDAMITCASFWALSSQLQAEGSLAFDFSGQGISLNVDRTPQIEAALGRMQEMMYSRLIPLKKQLIINGITGGDGSIGANLTTNPRSKGMLALTNSPTTRYFNQNQSVVGTFLPNRRY